jgi:radical SAM protein with 4Fe4S-binding SPASM domain
VRSSGTRPEPAIATGRIRWAPSLTEPSVGAGASLAGVLAMRTSSYVIHVDLPDRPDEVLLVHGYTGAYDVVSRPVASYLRANEPSRHKPAVGDWPEEPIVTADAPSDATIARLAKRGYLTDQSVPDERERVRALANITHPEYVFMMTYDCSNLQFAHSSDHIEHSQNQTTNSKRRFFPLPVLATQEITRARRERTLATNDTCLSCKYAFFCRGGCVPELEGTGEYCSGFQDRFRVAAAETFNEEQAGIRVAEVASSLWRLIRTCRRWRRSRARARAR